MEIFLKIDPRVSVLADLEIWHFPLTLLVVLSPYNYGRSWEFAKGEQKKGRPPAGSRGRAPVRIWGRNPQKPETHAEYSTEHSHRSSQIAYCSESDYTLKKFPATTGGHAPMSPLATPLKVSVKEWLLSAVLPAQVTTYKMSCKEGECGGVVVECSLTWRGNKVDSVTKSHLSCDRRRIRHAAELILGMRFYLILWFTSINNF